MHPFERATFSVDFLNSFLLSSVAWLKRTATLLLRHKNFAWNEIFDFCSLFRCFARSQSVVDHTHAHTHISSCTENIFFILFWNNFHFNFSLFAGESKKNTCYSMVQCDRLNERVSDERDVMWRYFQYDTEPIHLFFCYFFSSLRLQNDHWNYTKIRHDHCMGICFCFCRK